MKISRIILASVLAVMTMCSLVSCGDKDKKDDVSTGSNVSSVPKTEATTNVEDTADYAAYLLSRVLEVVLVELDENIEDVDITQYAKVYVEHSEGADLPEIKLFGKNIAPRMPQCWNDINNIGNFGFICENGKCVSIAISKDGYNGTYFDNFGTHSEIKSISNADTYSVEEALTATYQAYQQAQENGKQIDQANEPYKYE